MSDNKMEFSEDDRERLARSVAWQTQPRLVESMCWILYKLDPAGICLSENPRAATEYLTEVGMLLDRMPAIASEHKLSQALQDIFCETFDETAAAEDWASIAASLWPLVKGARRVH